MYDARATWFVSYISLRDLKACESDIPFQALFGLDKQLLGLVEVEEKTWIVDIDADVMWKSRDR